MPGTPSVGERSLKDSVALETFWASSPSFPPAGETDLGRWYSDGREEFKEFSVINPFDSQVIPKEAVGDA